MVKVIRGIGILSLVKIAGIIYASLGLIVGVIVAFVALLGGFAGMVNEGGIARGFIGIFLGVGAVIALPVFYGLLGCLVGLIVGAVYNVAARMVGGLEIEVD